MGVKDKRNRERKNIYIFSHVYAVKINKEKQSS